ncbi:MAG: S8 family serine peptidase, partial [Chloroflexi bacterium]|nr:S8 family serine peptidase [Chloroflexota bacterium]
MPPHIPPHTRTDALAFRRVPYRHWLLLTVLIAAVGIRDGAAGPDLATLGPLPPDADALYVEPIDGITPGALAHALTSLGFGDAESAHDGVRVPLRTDQDPIALAHRLAASGLARSVEADAVLTAARLPDDPLVDGHQQAYLDAVRTPEAWETVTGDDRVVIAVVDTGVDWNHPDLVDRIFINEDEQFQSGRDDDANGCVDDFAGCNFVTLSTADPSCGYFQQPPNWRAQDDEGHGTFVAGVAAATGDNGTGIAGIAWRARILPVKVLDCTATGRVSDAVAGIRYAARMGADVINISFGTPNDSPALREAVIFAQAQGAVIVASAGNDGRSGVTFPARYPGVLSVAASGILVDSPAAAPDGTADPQVTEETRETVDYTRTADFARFGEPVDFLAPGVGLVGTVPPALCARGDWACLDDGPYASGSGSSYATAVVTGAMALMISQHPERSAEFAAGLLLAGRSFTPGEPGGLLDIAAAVSRPIYSGGVPGTASDGSTPPAGSLP